MELRKKELTDLLYEKLEFTKKECAPIVESFFEIIKDELGKGNPVNISGFGKWVVKSKRERNGRNPQTGEDLTIAARKVVSFKPSGKLKDKLNTGG